ncbi:hypothetical protein CCR75_000780 [Bremia lactucae]|uniref:B30.2/SPRY domain-containing protein n=1 Tax=Bremia lactucae TaxID=4779 RepID=A0A976NY09_BRELC|nr:hypothetical protein CCR75_000780 [Bremia lactucae]
MEAQDLEIVSADTAVLSSSAYTNESGPIENAPLNSYEIASQNEAWGVGDEEDGWMPKPARLHSGRTRSCAVCFAPLQRTSFASWDDYLQSQEYLTQLQTSFLQDAFISSLLCGENTAGDLPTEHRMHKNRKLKCRQNVSDYKNMTSAGWVNNCGTDKGAIRTLEEMLIEALPTPEFTHVLERRLAVVCHSSKIVSKLMSHDSINKIPRPVETALSNEELHHLAIHTLGVLLRSFDYSSPKALESFKELSQLLTCFPVLSLFSFWSPRKKPPDKLLILTEDEVGVTSVTTDSDLHGVYNAIDGLDTTFWQSRPRPGAVHFELRSSELERVTSINIHWHMNHMPQSVGVQCRIHGSESFVQVVKDHTPALSGPTIIMTSFPGAIEEARIVMAGVPASNRGGTYAIKHLQLNTPAPNSLFANPKSTVSAIAYWLLGACQNTNEVMVAEAIGAFRAWALATASLHVTLLFVDMLLRFRIRDNSLYHQNVMALALEQGQHLLKGIQAFYREELHNRARKSDEAAIGNISKAEASFESSVCSNGVIVEDGGRAVRTRETSYQYAAVNCGIFDGKASWIFRLDTDTQDDEMTCFGAATLPVTVNGYDSSPSLWMLRGYNGNLYARGHKVSRTIGKVHPGDIVQVDIDMAEGTLAYKINGTDYGVVFTDLAGQEVHPAVSFYGSGKVISLLGVTRWDCPALIPAGIDPVFLSNLREHHFFVGYGTLGKGGQLGYASNGDSNISSGIAATTGSNLIRIKGEAKVRCLSTHPPSHGDAYVMYDLFEAYYMLQGAVAINDDSRDEQNHETCLVFKIYGDDKLLWQSEQISESCQIEFFEVVIKDVRMLELKVSCLGSNFCAHAVWVDPFLHPVKEWACSKCSFVCKGCSKLCTLCRNGIRPESISLAAAADTKLVIPAVYTDDVDGRSMTSLSDLGTTIIRQIDDLYKLRLVRHNAYSSSAKSFLPFEEPFCRQPSRKVFLLLLDILQRCHAQCISSGVDAEAHCARDGCVHILGIISANLVSVHRHDVEELTAKLGGLSGKIIDLRRELEAISSISEDFQRQTNHLVKDVQMAAARTIVAGLPVLYSSALDKLTLLLQLLRLYIKYPVDVSSDRNFMLTSVMKILTTPGPDGILTLMPFNEPEPACLKIVEENLWLTAVKQTISLLMQIVVSDHRKFLTSQANNSVQETIADDFNAPASAIRLLKMYQLVLLSKAVALTNLSASSNELEQQVISRRRLQLQDAIVQLSFLCLHAYRDLVDNIVTSQAEESFFFTEAEAAQLLDVPPYKFPLLSEVLPWFLTCLCLLQRQAWLARSILPPVVRLLEALDHYCSESQLVKKSARRFQELEIYKNARLLEANEVERANSYDRDPNCRSSKRLYNVFYQLYTGEKDHFEGQIGFQFEATRTFNIAALGRSVNPMRHGGRLLRAHTIRLWEDKSQLLIAQVLVGGSSTKDVLGYALEMLSTPVRIIQGKIYRLTTQEFANGGDPWYKRENLPSEEYDESFIKILRDCYASRSTGFPGSQNMTGATYGVPTLLVQDETPLTSFPQFVPAHGCLSLRFNTKDKLPSVSISHSGTSAYVKDGIDTWRTCILRTSFLYGVHSVDFALKCSLVGGIVSGHLCVGVVWRQPLINRVLPQSSPHDTFVGETPNSIGWMPSVGAIWVQGIRYDYGSKISVAAGDVFTVTIDYDLQILAFAYNGRNIGVAVGPKKAIPLGAIIDKLPNVVTPAVSLYGAQDVIQVRPSGIAKSTLRIHWLFDLHNSLASLAGRLASTLIAGHPVDGVEEELLPWLQSPLLSGGIAESSIGQNRFTISEPLCWSDALQLEYNRCQLSGEESNVALQSKSALLNKEEEPAAKQRGFQGHIESIKGASQHNSSFWQNWTAEMTECGIVQLIMSWLEKHYPDRTFLRRLGKFPSCERWMCAALIMHAPSHVLQEAEAIAAAAGASKAGEIIAAESFLADADFSPSDDLIYVWKRILALRHWLIKARQEYRAREADEPFSNEQAQDSNPTLMKAEGFTLTSDSKRLFADRNLEHCVMMPRSFDDLVGQVIQRAEFLCKLAPPSDGAENVNGDSQIALFNLAEKWSSQKTPPLLQPMLERWKTLGEVDSSKWSGIVDVLRAQHRWRARRASIQEPAPIMSSNTRLSTERDDCCGCEDSDDLQPNKKYDYTNRFSAMMKACELYIRDGIGAPPEILTMLLEKRQRRSDSRLFGFQAMKSILSLLSYDSAIHNALIFLRPAMRGFSESEKESRELNDGQVVAETFRATVRHHYLNGLEGCNRQTINSIQCAFRDLYTYLAELLSRTSSDAVSDPQLIQAILCAWSLDFEPQDHQFLLDTGMLKKLQETFSINSIIREAAAAKTIPIPTRKLARNYTSINWHPLSDKFVQQGLLHSGFIVKRDVIRLLHRAPHYARSADTFDRNKLATKSSDVIELSARHTTSSLSLLYADMLNRLQQKLLGPPSRTHTCKTLLFGGPVTQTTGRVAQSPDKSMPNNISYVEMPALGEIHDFTIELWLFPTELQGYQALRCDNGVQNGSVYLELVGRHVQLSIPGNFPRERIFMSYSFQTFEWTHCAVAYSCTEKFVQLIVNGALVETLAFERVYSTVQLRASRLGCWMSDVDVPGASLKNISAQRKFKGSIAELRIWRISRACHEVLQDFQRSIPLINRPINSLLSTFELFSRDMIGLWHLTEGEGICGYDSASTLKATKEGTKVKEGLKLTIFHCHWVPSCLPVFGNDTVSGMLSNEWNKTIKCICLLQRKIRLWLVKEFDDAVRLSKLMCDYHERKSIQKYSQIIRINGDDDSEAVLESDEAVLESDEAYIGPIESERCPLNDSLLIDMTTSQLLSHWNACTDEQILVSKQTRRCAWIVFRFLACTGITGAYDRREGEAKSIAAAAKLKRKQRLQKDESLHTQTIDLTYEDAAARTAEAACDAAKSAATNRELEKPVLQTLWFSKEFHRKVFEILERELIQGKELIKDTEGLTRAQRVTRSVSTPLQKRNLNLRHYPSDVARANDNLVNHTPSNITENSNILEPLEVEMHLYEILLFMLSQSQQPPAVTHLARPHMLRGLLEMLFLASPRSQRVNKLLLRKICCSGNVKPSDVGAILGSESVFIDLLLDQVADSMTSVVAPVSPPALNALASSSPVATRRVTLMSSSESLSSQLGFQSGRISLVIASESVALLRRLLMEKQWKHHVAENLCNVISNISPFLAKKKDISPSLAMTDADPSDIRFRAAITRAVGALCVLGSHSDCIRIGGKVVVASQDVSGCETDSSVDDCGQTVRATLIEMSSHAPSVRVVFHPTSPKSEFDPSHNVQDINLSSLSPIEEICLSPTVVPQTLEMMLVIFQLASLDETSALKRFDSLWRLQIRSRALLAFDALLRYSIEKTQNFAHKIAIQRLLQLALTPIRLDSFLSLPVLQERGRIVLCRMIESATPLGEAMFRGLPEPTPQIYDLSDMAPTSVVEINENPSEEESEANRVRRGFASTLAAMGFEFDLCMAALTHSRDDPNMAVEWLMGDGALTYQQRQEARRLAQASLAFHELDGEAEGSPCLALEGRATELQNISGLPYCLTYCALELSNNDSNRAMEWLMEFGNVYAEDPDLLDLLKDPFSAARMDVLDDKAALEEIEQLDLLVTTHDRHNNSILEDLGPAPSMQNADLTSASNVDGMGVSLAPILASRQAQINLTIALPQDASMNAYPPLDPEYLTPNILLVVASHTGSVQQLRAGVYQRYSSDNGVLLTFLNTETGAYENEWHSPRDLRRIEKIYDEPLESVASIQRVALKTENALSIFYARRAITALLCAFNSEKALKAPAFELATERDQDIEKKPPRALFSFSSQIYGVVGSPVQLISLLKLVAASEMNSFQRSDIETMDTFAQKVVGGKSTAINQPSTLLASLKMITLRILYEEFQMEKLTKSNVKLARVLSRNVASANSHEIFSKFGSEHMYSESIPRALKKFDEGDECNSKDSSREVAMSIEEMPPFSATPRKLEELSARKQEDYYKNNNLLDIQVGNTLNCIGRSQFSNTDAQEYPSTRMSSEGHGDYFSKALVQECVSHFGESTRMAADGESSPIQEFQSLHPYFGRCDYARAVTIDSSFHCLRIVFDSRCRLGPTAKLNFFADSDCKSRISEVDYVMTTPGHHLPDLIVHSHQFWFRFSASEEIVEKGCYGYRFQVKPMANIRWFKESEVQANPSLEWACWVLELLLNDANELLARGAVHNCKIYDALVRYLRSPGAPYKGRVVRLLQQLLHRPECFPTDEVPNLHALESIVRLALSRAELDRGSGKTFLSTHLLQLVELSVMISSTSTIFSSNGTTPLPLVLAPLNFPEPFELKRVHDSLYDVSEITKFLLGQTENLPQHVLVAIWLEVYGSSRIIETSHPYAVNTSFSGVVTFKEAQVIQITFDSRCSLAAGHGHGVAMLELISFSFDSHEDGLTKNILSNGTYAGESGWPDRPVLLNGNNLEYTFLGDENNVGDHFGIAFTVTAFGISLEKQLSKATIIDMEELLVKLVSMQAVPDGWTPEMDLQLVDWVNNYVEVKASLQSNPMTTPKHSADVKPAEIRLKQAQDGLRCSHLLGLPLERLQLRFALLKYLNQSLRHCLSLLDLRDTKSPWTIAHRLRQLSHCIFFDVKSTLVDAAIEATNVTDIGGDFHKQTARITLDRMQALESRDDREVEPSVSECFFAQAFRQLHFVDPALFRRQIDSKGRLFNVKFRGEEGVDWGGVYREGATSMVDDLFSPHFALFVLCPNGQHDTGNNRGMYLPNPKCTSPVAMQMFAFVGQLLGISLRTHGDFPFMLPSLVWKQLLGQTLTRADLEDTDAMFIQMLDGIAHCESDGILTEEEFATAFAGLELRYTASSCTGEEIELVPGGITRKVDFLNRLEYCRLAERARLEECSAQVAAMARGFATLFPRRVLTLLTWQELEILACGSPKIDLDLWKSHTRYDGYAEEDVTVQLFWEVLGELSDEQRADFVRFAWGRSRLPRGKWPQPFKLSKKSGRDATRSLPVAHTCFFSVELPPYTSLETMRSMLLATITFGLGGILMA